MLNVPFYFLIVIVAFEYSVLDVNASDLPAEVKTGLKSLAHDLAGALVFDYGELCFVVTIFNQLVCSVVSVNVYSLS